MHIQGQNLAPFVFAQTIALVEMIIPDCFISSILPSLNLFSLQNVFLELLLLFYSVVLVLLFPFILCLLFPCISFPFPTFVALFCHVISILALLLVYSLFVA